MKIGWIAVAALALSGVSVNAEYYSYMNAENQYVITRQPPSDPNIEYAVLNDHGDYVRSVVPRPATAKRQNIPIDHWRPWYLPKEPSPLDAVIPETEQVPTVTVEEMDSDRGQ